MQVTVTQHVEWKKDIYLRDEPYGDNAVILKPLQIAVLLDEANFPEGTSVRLPQPDASYSAITVVRHAVSWHFLQPGAELILDVNDWPGIRESIRHISET